MTSSAFADVTVYIEGNGDGSAISTYSSAAQEFENLTGEKIVFIDGAFSDNLKRLNANKAAGNIETPDLLITKDIVHLAELKASGLTQAFTELSIFNKVYPSMKDTENQWVGLSYRTRTLVYGSQVDVSGIETYTDLAQPEWAGRLCLRTSTSNYNRSLAAYLLAEYGESESENILMGWMDNLAMDVFQKDSLILEAINNGECEIGLVNHYYLAREVAAAQGKGLSYNVDIKYLNQNQDGVHTNGYGISLLLTSKDTVLAEKFVEILLSDRFQLEFTKAQYTFPVIMGLEANTLIKDWGSFKPSDVNWSEIADALVPAQNLVEKVKYN